MSNNGSRWLSQKLRSLADDTESGRFLEVIWNGGRKLTFWVTVLYAIFLLGLRFALQWVGERNVTAAFCLYLPPLVWLLPLCLLMPLALLFHRRCFVFLVALAVFTIWGWLGFQLGEEKRETADGRAGLSVMTYNRGQNMNQSLQPFKNATNPDVLVFQEAGGRADGFLRSTGYAEFGHGVSVGEFTLLSRYPITSNTLVQDAASQRPARAARFTIDWNGRMISVYAVHLMTPRDVLRSYMRGAFLWGVLGVPGTPWAKKREYYQSFWDGQMQDAKMILDAVRTDPNPCIVAGDFNAPHTGYLHRMVTRELIDSHATSGHGFGFTFPGVTHNPLSLGGPWMRIDYIFHDRRWDALECITEKDRPSQHRALVAKLRLTSAGP